MARSLRRSRSWIVVGVVAALVWTAAKVAVPLLARWAIDDGIAAGRTGGLLGWTSAIVGLTLVIAVTTALRRYAAFAISLRSEADIRRQLYAHLQGLSASYHDRAQTGELMSRSGSDLRQIQLLLVFVPVAGANIVMILAVAVVLFGMDARLAAAALLPLPFLIVAAVRFHHRLHGEAVGLQEELAGVSSVVEQSVSGIRVLKGFGAEPLAEERLNAAAAGVYGRALGVARLRAGFTPLMELLPTLGLVAVLYVGGREVIDGRLTVGELVAFNFYILQLIFPLRLTAVVVANLSRAWAAAARVYEVLATVPEIVDRPNAAPLPDGPGELRFEDVGFTYPGGPPVLRGLDLTVSDGESVAIVGPTGCGKSTVARLIPRFYDVTSGRVVLDGADVRHVRVAELRRAVGLVFEDTFLFRDTVRANLAFADPEASQADVERAARLAGAEEFITDLPAGYETVLGEQGMSLSGGQRQRIAIARAVLADPRVLVLDDATSSVDPTKEHEIRESLREVMRGRTTIVIAHRPATIALADRVVLLDQGRIVAEGTHDGLLRTSATYRSVLAQAGEWPASPTEVEV